MMTRFLTNHDEIKSWAEAREATPAKNMDGTLRLDFPGLQEDIIELSWDSWFTIFEAKKLAVIIEDEAALPKRPSRFHQIVDREPQPNDTIAPQVLEQAQPDMIRPDASADLPAIDASTKARNKPRRPRKRPSQS